MPNTLRCEFCGKALKPRTVEIAGRKITCGYFVCGCPESQKQEADKCRQWEEETDRHEAEERKARIKRAGIPERYADATTDRDELVEQAKEGGLYLFGPVGTGKTHLACAIAIRLLDQGRTVRFVKAADVVDMLSGFDSTRELEQITSPYLLVIDDLGMEDCRDWADRRLRRAIDARWDTGKPLIITSNYARDEIGEAMGDMTNAEAMLSRLFGMTKSVELTGEDRRLS